MSLLRTLSGLVLDNPIILKDGVLALRRRRHLGALALAAVGVLVGATLIWLDESAALEWAPDRPVGDGLVAVMFGIAFLMAGVLLPASASATLSGEREHGTLPLLTVTGLAPARVVVGKILAMLVLAAPFVALPIPFIVGGALNAGIPLPFVGVGLAGLVVSMVAFAAVGVYGSSLTARSRTSAPAALLGAIVPAVCCAIPAFDVVVSAVDNSLRPEEVMGAVAGLFGGAMIAVAAAYGAWSNLAARSTPRFRPATALFLAVVVGLPCVAVVIATLDWDAITGLQSWSSHRAEPLFIFSFLFSSAATLLYAAGVGRDQRAPSPLGLVPLAVTVATVTFAVAIQPIVGTDRATTDNDIAGVLTLWLHVVGAAAAAAAFGRLVNNTLLGAVLGGAATLVVILIPAIADEFIVGRPPLGFLNVAYVRFDDLLATVAFWGAWSIGALLLARRRS